MEDILYLALKILLVGLLFVILFTFFFGVCRTTDDSMKPAVEEGDLVIYYRLQKEYQAGDAVVVEYEGQKQVRRIIAVAGDTVDITEEGLAINGYLQQESGIYTETLPYVEGIFFPITVGEGEVFLMGDNRPQAEDSRIYGTVAVRDICGSAMTILRRRGI